MPTAIITGASQGIGAGLVQGFLDEGYDVVGTARNATRQLSPSSRLLLVDGDIGKRETAAEVVRAAADRFGTIDVLGQQRRDLPRQSVHGLHGGRLARASGPGPGALRRWWGTRGALVGLSRQNLVQRAQ
jgi:hypothetical protein